MKPSQMNTPKPDEDSGEFAGYDTVDAICAYVFHKEGEAGLRWVIGQAYDPNEPPKDGWGLRESLEDAAAELERRGLDKPAAILRDHAKDLRSGIEAPPDYMVRAGPRAVEGWRERWIQRRHIHLGTFGEYLRQGKADKLPPLADYKRVKPIPRA
jgi:hypothetical protein